MGRRAGLAAVAAVVALVMACSGQPSLVVSHTGDPGVPAPRTGASSAYDAADATIVMFGGADRSGALDETWTWDGSTWRRQHPLHSPPAREMALMAFDAGTGRVVVFGGLACPPPAPDDPIGCDYSNKQDHLNDTWTWDGRDWSRVTTRHQPTVAIYGPTVSGAGGDIAHRQLILVVLTVPVAAGAKLATWTFRDGDWQQLKGKAELPDLDFSGPAFDAASGRLILQQSVGPHVDCGPNVPRPCSPGLPHNTTWAWDGSGWNDLGAALGTPYDSGTLVEAGTHGVLLFGVATVEQWDGKRWGTPVAQPWDGLRTGWTASLDARTNEVIIFGGRAWETNHLFGDTLGWDGSVWTTLVAAAPSPSQAIGACDPGSAVAGLGGYGGGPSISPTSIALGIAFFEPKSGPCHLDVVVTFSLNDSNGRLIPIAGNPSQVEVVADLTYEWGFEYATFTITNACGLPGDVVATFGGSDIVGSIPAVRANCPDTTGAPVTIEPGTLHRPEEK